MNKIGWCDETINPVIGCTKISPACDHCYAEVMARRLAGMKYTREYGKVLTNNKWNGRTIFRSNELLKPGRWKNPRKIFVVSMGDLFHESVPFEWIDKIIGLISDTPRHTYLFLTKRPEICLEFFKWFGNEIKKVGFDSIPTQSSNPLDYYDPLPNLWIGVTVENQEQAEKRIPILLQIPSSKKFISCEPLLESLDLSKWISPCSYYCSHTDEDFAEYTTSYEFNQLDEGSQMTECAMFYRNNHRSEPSKIDWVIAGGETGPKARLPNIEWFRSLRNQCKDTNIPFFFKKIGTNILTPPDLLIKEFPK